MASTLQVETRLVFTFVIDICIKQSSHDCATMRFLYTRCVIKNHYGFRIGPTHTLAEEGYKLEMSDLGRFVYLN